jgi:hypothetical protein
MPLGYVKLKNNMSNITLVTGLWDIKRDELKDGWSRTYNHYIDKFNQLLDVPYNLIIFGDQQLKEVVYQRRSENNTQFITRDQSWFKNEFYNKIQEIRKNENWLHQTSWLKDSTQASLELYNPLVMSKPFLLHDAKILDKFNSTHLFWVDAGITNTVHKGYFTHDNVLDKLKNINKITFVAFPYNANNEIHGFEYESMCNIVNDKINKVCRGGFFGGPKESITSFNSEYYYLMSKTLNNNLMGTEESLFTILLYSDPKKYQYHLIESNGLLNSFFEDLKNEKLQLLNESKIQSIDVSLYVITYNSPLQFEKLCLSFEQYDTNFLIKTKKYLLNNSIDKSTFDEYDRLCELYGFEEIHKDNIGICGGRQFIAEHFDMTGLDYYLFFEDDMFFYPKKSEVCRNGFNRHFDDFFNKTIEIMSNENFDFLKLNYSEFYGDNGTQWSWYNVPQSVREEYWPNNSKLPKKGLDPNAPKTKFGNILSHNGIPYASGEIYYCNWPQIVSKSGNRKMFLDTKWGHPYEQTWMSHIYQETKKGKIKPGLILGTPTEHDRFDFYPKEERREN